VYAKESYHHGKDTYRMALNYDSKFFTLTLVLYDYNLGTLHNMFSCELVSLFERSEKPVGRRRSFLSGSIMEILTVLCVPVCASKTSIILALKSTNLGSKCAEFSPFL